MGKVRSHPALPPRQSCRRYSLRIANKIPAGQGGITGFSRALSEQAHEWVLGRSSTSCPPRGSNCRQLHARDWICGFSFSSCGKCQSARYTEGRTTHIVAVGFASEEEIHGGALAEVGIVE